MGSTMRGTPKVVAVAAAVTLDAARGAVAVAGESATNAIVPATTAMSPTLRMPTSAWLSADCRICGRGTATPEPRPPRSVCLLLVVVVEAAARLPAQQLG